MMRFVISIVAALMILGLAAFGIVSAQKIVRHVFADDRFRFGGRSGAASRTRAASSGQSGEPNRANRRRIGSGARRHTDADG
jgi:hypothetical protein